MNGLNLLLDTNILLYLLNGDETLAELLQGKKTHISFVTELELYGFKLLTETEKETIGTLMGQCNIIDINPQIKTSTIEIRQNHKIKLPDAIIAATAMYLNVPLITADKDFENINNLNLIYYQI